MSSAPTRQSPPAPSLIVLPPRSGARTDDPDDGPDARPLDFGLIRRLMSYSRPYSRKLRWLLLTVFIRSVQLPFGAWALAQVINGPIARGSVRGTILGTMGFGALALWTSANFHFRARLALQLGEAVIHDLRADVFAHLQRMTMGFYHRTKLGRIISRLTSDVEAVRLGVQDVLFVTLVQIGQMLVAGALMFWCDRALFCVVMAIVPLLWAINQYFRSRLSQAYRQGQESFSRITATMAETVNGIRVTQGFVRQEVNAELFRELVADHFRVGFGAARLTAVFLPLLELNSQFFIAVLLALGGWRALHSAVDMPVGSMIQFFFLASWFFQPVSIIGQQYNQALMAMAGAERIFRLLDRPPDWQDDPQALPMPPIRGQVEFRAVNFAYQENGPLVLRDVSFTAEAGRTVALVGHTGSGKSSIINLVNKFYLPTAGEIFIDGREIRQCESESLHRQMALVSQTNFLFSGTVADNIRFGRPGAPDEELREVCRHLDCLDLLENLPQGLQTNVGERGGGLSGGQRQLVCFARALLADPRILILDEATSAIDALTEQRLQRALAALLAGRTSFVVAHRLSTIRHADQVLVLAEGRIVERGAHTALLARNRVYAGLYREFVRGAGA